MLGAVLKLLRPHQWLKNSFVLAGPLFGRHWDDWSAALLLFAAFCAMASAVYIGNDLRDIESDRRHPKKRLRPLAAGSVPAALAKTIALALALAGVLISAWVSTVALKVTLFPLPGSMP